MANVYTTLSNTTVYTDKLQIVTGNTAVTCQVYAVALGTAAAAGNLFTKGLADNDIKVGEKIPGTNAVKKKDIDEGILASTRALWKKYQE